MTGRWIISPRTGAGLRQAGPSTSDGGELALERSYKRGMGKFPPHVHFEFAERFELISGGAVAVFDGDEQRLVGPPVFGDPAFRSVLYIPPGVPHVNPYNFDCEELVVRQSFSTATAGVRTYVETLAEVMAEGRDDDGELPWPLVLAVAHVSGEESYLTPAVRRRPRGPRWSFEVQSRVLQPVGGVVAGTCDYLVQLPPSTPLTMAVKATGGTSPSPGGQDLTKGGSKVGRALQPAGPWTEMLAALRDKGVRLKAFLLKSRHTSPEEDPE